MTERQPNIMCPYCKEMKGRRQGKVMTVNSGLKQRYICKECGRSWYNGL